MLWTNILCERLDLQNITFTTFLAWYKLHAAQDLHCLSWVYRGCLAAPHTHTHKEDCSGVCSVSHSHAEDQRCRSLWLFHLLSPDALGSLCSSSSSSLTLKSSQHSQALVTHHNDVTKRTWSKSGSRAVFHAHMFTWAALARTYPTCPLSHRPTSHTPYAPTRDAPQACMLISLLQATRQTLVQTHTTHTHANPAVVCEPRAVPVREGGMTVCVWRKIRSAKIWLAPGTKSERFSFAVYKEHHVVYTFNFFDVGLNKAVDWATVQRPRKGVSGPCVCCDMFYIWSSNPSDTDTRHCHEEGLFPFPP